MICYNYFVLDTLLQKYLHFYVMQSYFRCLATVKHIFIIYFAKHLNRYFLLLPTGQWPDCCIFLASGGGLPLYLEILQYYKKYLAVAQVNCGYQIRTLDPWSLLRYHWTTTYPYMGTMGHGRRETRDTTRDEHWETGDGILEVCKRQETGERERGTGREKGEDKRERILHV